MDRLPANISQDPSADREPAPESARPVGIGPALLLNESHGSVDMHLDTLEPALMRDSPATASLASISESVNGPLLRGAEPWPSMEGVVQAATRDTDLALTATVASASPAASRGLSADARGHAHPAPEQPADLEGHASSVRGPRHSSSGHAGTRLAALEVRCTMLQAEVERLCSRLDAGGAHQAEAENSNRRFDSLESRSRLGDLGAEVRAASQRVAELEAAAPDLRPQLSELSRAQARLEGDCRASLRSLEERLAPLEAASQAAAPRSAGSARPPARHGGRGLPAELGHPSSSSSALEHLPADASGAGGALRVVEAQLAELSRADARHAEEQGRLQARIREQLVALDSCREALDCQLATLRDTDLRLRSLEAQLQRLRSSAADAARSPPEGALSTVERLAALESCSGDFHRKLAELHRLRAQDEGRMDATEKRISEQLAALEGCRDAVQQQLSAMLHSDQRVGVIERQLDDLHGDAVALETGVSALFSLYAELCRAEDGLKKEPASAADPPASGTHSLPEEYVGKVRRALERAAESGSSLHLLTKLASGSGLDLLDANDPRAASAEGQPAHRPVHFQHEGLNALIQKHTALESQSGEPPSEGDASPASFQPGASSRSLAGCAALGHAERRLATLEQHCAAERLRSLEDKVSGALLEFARQPDLGAIRDGLLAELRSGLLGEMSAKLSGELAKFAAEQSQQISQTETRVSRINAALDGCSRISEASTACNGETDSSSDPKELPGSWSPSTTPKAYAGELSGQLIALSERLQQSLSSEASRQLEELQGAAREACAAAVREELSRAPAAAKDAGAPPATSSQLEELRRELEAQLRQEAAKREAREGELQQCLKAADERLGALRGELFAELPQLGGLRDELLGSVQKLEGRVAAAEQKQARCKEELSESACAPLEKVREDLRSGLADAQARAQQLASDLRGEVAREAAERASGLHGLQEKLQGALQRELEAGLRLSEEKRNLQVSAIGEELRLQVQQEAAERARALEAMEGRVQEAAHRGEELSRRLASVDEAVGGLREELCRAPPRGAEAVPPPAAPQPQAAEERGAPGSPGEPAVTLSLLRRFLADVRAEMGAGLEQAHAQAAQLAEGLRGELLPQLKREAAALREEVCDAAEAGRESTQRSLAELRAELSAGLAEARRASSGPGEGGGGADWGRLPRLGGEVDELHAALHALRLEQSSSVAMCTARCEAVEARVADLDPKGIGEAVEKRLGGLRDELQAQASSLAEKRVSDVREELVARLPDLSGAQREVHESLQKARDCAAEAAQAVSALRASKQAVADLLKQSLADIRQELSGGLAEAQVKAEHLTEVLRGALEDSREAAAEQLQRALAEGGGAPPERPEALRAVLERQLAELRAELILRLEREAGGLRGGLDELRGSVETLKAWPAEPPPAGAAAPDLAQRLAALREELRAQMAEVKEVALRDASGAVVELRQQLAVARQDTEALRSELGSAQLPFAERLERLEAELRSVDARLERLPVGELRQGLAAARQDAEALRSELGSAQRPLAERLEGLEVELRGVDTRLEGLRTAAAAGPPPQQLERDFAAVCGAAEACASEGASLRRRHLELEGRLEATAEQLGALRGELREQVAQLTQKLAASSCVEEQPPLAAPQDASRKEGEASQKLEEVRELVDCQSKQTSQVEGKLQSLVSQHGDLERHLASLEQKLRKDLQGVEEALLARLPDSPPLSVVTTDLAERLAALRKELRAEIVAEVTARDEAFQERDRAVGELRERVESTQQGMAQKPLSEQLQQVWAELHRVEAKAEQLCGRLAGESLPQLERALASAREDAAACSAEQAAARRQRLELEAGLAAATERIGTIWGELKEQAGRAPEERQAAADSRLAELSDQLYALRMEVSARSESEARARDAVALRVQRAALREELVGLGASSDEKLAALRAELLAALQQARGGEAAGAAPGAGALSAEVEVLRSEQSSAASQMRRLELGLADVRRMTAEFAAGSARRLDVLEASANSHRCRASGKLDDEEDSTITVDQRPQSAQTREPNERHAQRAQQVEEWLQALLSKHGDLERRLATLERRLQKELRGVEEPLEETLSQLATGVLKLAQLVGVAPEDACTKLGWREACADLPRLLDHAWLRSRLPKRASLLRLVRQKADAEQLRELRVQVEGLAAGAAAAAGSTCALLGASAGAGVGACGAAGAFWGAFANATTGSGGAPVTVAEERYAPNAASRPQSARASSPAHSAEPESGFATRPPTAPPASARPAPHVGAAAAQRLRSPGVAGRAYGESPRAYTESPRLRHVRAPAAETAPVRMAGQAPPPPPRLEAWAASANDAEPFEGREESPGRPGALLGGFPAAGGGERAAERF